jgi:hypothetical protein
MTLQPATRPSGSGNLVELLDRVLDKGLVVIGDIGVSVAGIELLSLRIRLLVASLDRAEELGLDLSWAGIDQSKIGPAEERPALAGVPEERPALAAPAEDRYLPAPPEEDGTSTDSEQLARLQRRLVQLEQRLAKKTARRTAAHPAR